MRFALPLRSGACHDGKPLFMGASFQTYDDQRRFPSSLKRMTSKVSLKLNSKDVPARVRIMRSNLPYVSKEGMATAAIGRIRRATCVWGQALQRPVD